MTDLLEPGSKKSTAERFEKSSYVFESRSFGVVDLGGFESLMILEGVGDAPDGYRKIPIDLNKGTGQGTPYLFFCYKLATEGGKAIIDLQVRNTAGDGRPKQSRGYYYCRDQNNRVKDLNAGAGGDYIWCSYSSQDPEDGQQIITGIDLLAYPGGRRHIPQDWTLVDSDLNAGCGSGSWYVYLLYRSGVRTSAIKN